MFPIENVEDIQRKNEAVSLESQVKVVRLQDKLGKQNYHHKTEELFESVSDTIKNSSENLKKAIIVIF